MNSTGERRRKLSSAVMVYLILLLSLQVFLLIVAAEGFLEGDAALAWAATGVSTALAAGALFFFRYLLDD